MFKCTTITDASQFGDYDAKNTETRNLDFRGKNYREKWVKDIKNNRKTNCHWCLLCATLLRALSRHVYVYIAAFRKDKR